MNYAELKLAVTGYLHRTDLTSKVGELIERAEDMLFRRIDVMPTEVSVSGTSTSATIALPSDCDQPLRLTITTDGYEVSLDLFRRPLDGSGPVAAASSFTIEGTNIRLMDAPGAQYSYTLYYLPKMVNLSDSVTTNWLLTSHPDLYMYAAALEGARYVRNAPEVAKLELIVDGSPNNPGLIAQVKGKINRQRYPMTAPLQIKPRR